MDPDKAGKKSGVKVLLVVLGALVAVGLAFVAVIVLAVGGGVSQGMAKAQVETTRNSMRGVEASLRIYFARHGRFPDDRDGLQAVVKGGWLERLPNDAWGRPFVYRTEGTSYVLTSLGADGKPGGEGQDADLEHRPRP